MPAGSVWRDRRRSGLSRVWIGGAMALAMLQGCSPTKVTLDVAVRDAITAEPVVGCRVLAETPSKDHPFSIASLLGQTGPFDSSAVTDARGRATLVGLESRALRLGVWPRGGAPRFVLIEDVGSADAEVWWDVTGTPGSVERGMQVRVGRAD
ncbi:MAG: hypothetical protein K2W85_04555 [Phycisphaerales bacterium]|nr:hypothetical protein [Phycisphaerales bacterium]